MSLVMCLSAGGGQGSSLCPTIPSPHAQMLFITGDLISVSRAALGTRCYRGGNATPNPPGVLGGDDDMGTRHGTLPAKWAAGLPPPDSVLC